MNNVKFLRGEQSKLNNLTSFNEGAFYLTTDTDKLYFAQNDNKLVHLNRYIATVSTSSKLPLLTDVEIGEIYYVSDLNALVTKSEKDSSNWTQINAQIDTKVKDLSFNTVTENNNIKITCTLTQKDIKGDHIVDSDITGTLIIKGSDIGAVVAEIALDLDATIENNSATIGLVGSGIAENATGITMVGGDNVTISNDNGKVKISAIDSTYTLSSAENSTDIVLEDSIGDDSTISLKQGETNNSISVNGKNANEIVISHKDYNYSKDTLSDQTPGNAGKFDILSGISLENGHITGISTSKVTLPNMSYSIKNVAADKDGKISVVLADSTGDGPVVSSTQQLYYVIDGTNVYNQADLTKYFYTKDYIDSTLQSANAMTFKGHVGDDSILTELPADNVAAGDTYLVTGRSAILVGTTIGYKGDLFIAFGEENSETGYIDSEDLNWIHVPAGDEIDTTYTFSFSAAKNGLVIKDNITDDEIVLGISGGNAIDVNTDGSLIISHANIDRKDTAGEEDYQLNGEDSFNTFTAVTGVTSNEQGHITGINTQTFVIPSTDIYSLEKATNENKVILKDKVKDSAGSIEIKTDNYLNITSANPAEGSGIEFTIGHKTVNVTDNNTKPEEIILVPANIEDDDNKKFTVVTGYDTDDCGHLSEIEFTTFKMPYDSTYTSVNTIVGDETENSVKITSTLKDRLGDSAGALEFILTSDTLSVQVSEDDEKNKIVKTDIVWGSF